MKLSLVALSFCVAAASAQDLDPVSSPQSAADAPADSSCSVDAPQAEAYAESEALAESAGAESPPEEMADAEELGDEESNAGEDAEAAMSLPERLCLHAGRLLESLRQVQDEGSANTLLPQIRDNINEVDNLSEELAAQHQESPEAEELIQAILAEARRLADHDFYGDLYLRQLLGSDDDEEEASAESGSAADPAAVSTAIADTKARFSQLAACLQALKGLGDVADVLPQLRQALTPLSGETELLLEQAKPAELQLQVGDVIESVFLEAERIRQAQYFGSEELRSLLEGVSLW